MNAAERSIRLSGVDLVDGTPVLDIKPYVPEYDCPRRIGDPGAGAIEENYSDVRVAVRMKLRQDDRGGRGGGEGAVMWTGKKGTVQ